MLRIASARLVAVLIALLASSVADAAYPQKPIRFLIPFPPGGGTDILARALSDKLEKALGAPLIIDNRGGAGGTVGCAIAARAEPDGYTLLYTSASYTFAPGLYKDLPYDAVKDFRPITMFATGPLVLNVHPSMPVKNVKQLIALARNRPGEILYASAGPGSNIHLSTELFKYMAKVDLKQVPYKGGGPATIALVSGEVHVVILSLTGSMPFIKQGKMRALAVTTKERSPIMPDLPTIDESGVAGYDKGAWYGLFAPAAVPAPIVNHVYQATLKVLKDPDTVKRLAAEGAVAVGSPPEEFGPFVRSEIEQWTRLIRDMKLSAR